MINPMRKATYGLVSQQPRAVVKPEADYLDQQMNAKRHQADVWGHLAKTAMSPDQKQVFLSKQNDNQNAADQLFIKRMAYAPKQWSKNA